MNQTFLLIKFVLNFITIVSNDEAESNCSTKYLTRKDLGYFLEQNLESKFATFFST